MRLLPAFLFLVCVLELCIYSRWDEDAKKKKGENRNELADANEWNVTAECMWLLYVSACTYGLEV